VMLGRNRRKMESVDYCSFNSYQLMAPITTRIFTGSRGFPYVSRSESFAFGHYEEVASRHFFYDTAVCNASISRYRLENLFKMHQ